MKKYVVIYHANEEAMAKMKETPAEESKEGMKKWTEWADKCGDGLVDLGAPLGKCQKIDSSGASDSESNIVGYSLLQAEDLDGVKELLKDHPHLGWSEGCDIEVHETMPMPG